MFMTLMGVLCIAILCVSIVSYWLFWRQAMGTPHMEMLRQETNGHPGLWLGRGILSSIVSLVVTILLSPLFLIKRTWLQPGPKSDTKDIVRHGKKPPVLFVHGYLHTASAWVLFATWFRQAGYTDLHATSYNSWKLNFKGIVEQLETEIRAILSERPNEKIVLVCHSLGGLAVRSLLNTSELRPQILAVATLGTPHQGSTLAKLAMNDLGRKLKFRGPLIQQIEAEDMQTDVPCLAIYSPVDNMVMPLEGLRIRREGWEELQTAPICHVGMLYHRPSAQAVIRFINQAVRPRDN